jgi:hypothetical protein
LGQGRSQGSDRALRIAARTDQLGLRGRRARHSRFDGLTEGCLGRLETRHAPSRQTDTERLLRLTPVHQGQPHRHRNRLRHKINEVVEGQHVVLSGGHEQAAGATGRFSRPRQRRLERFRSQRPAAMGIEVLLGERHEQVDGYWLGESGSPAIDGGRDECRTVGVASRPPCVLPVPCQFRSISQKFGQSERVGHR